MFRAVETDEAGAAIGEGVGGMGHGASTGIDFQLLTCMPNETHTPNLPLCEGSLSCLLPEVWQTPESIYYII